MQQSQSPSPYDAFVAAGLVTTATQAVLEARMMRPDTTVPAFFTPAQFDVLQAVCRRLIPQPPEASRVDLPGLLDEQLAAGISKGWRYDVLPPEAILFHDGMDRVGTLARYQYGRAFQELDAAQQDAVLHSIQDGELPEAIWPAAIARRFFEDLLAGLVELYFSHPAAKDWIGDTSYAEAPGGGDTMQF